MRSEKFLSMHLHGFPIMPIPVHVISAFYHQAVSHAKRENTAYCNWCSWSHSLIKPWCPAQRDEPIKVPFGHERPQEGARGSPDPLAFDINFSHIITVAPRVEIQMHFWKWAKFAGSVGHPMTKMLSTSGGEARLTRGSAPGPRWGLCPQTPVIRSCSALAMVPPNHWPLPPPMANAVCDFQTASAKKRFYLRQCITTNILIDCRNCIEENVVVDAVEGCAQV